MTRPARLNLGSIQPLTHNTTNLNNSPEWWFSSVDHGSIPMTQVRVAPRPAHGAMSSPAARKAVQVTAMSDFATICPRPIPADDYQ